MNVDHPPLEKPQKLAIMRASPGGDLRPEHIVGRSALADHLWDFLENQSFRLEGERRIGKTLLAKLMISTARPGWRCVFMEISGLTSAVSFVNEVLSSLEGVAPEIRNTFANWFDKAIRNLSGLEVGGMIRIPAGAERHWRRLLIDAVKQVLIQTDANIVFFWDELPWMLEHILRTSGPDEVVELLATLRDLRMTFGERIRMVFVGSIGFHHILSELAAKGKAFGPVNDMPRIEVPPLDEFGCRELVGRLSIGEAIQTNCIEQVGDRIFANTGGVAYYIHHVMKSLGQREEAISPEIVDEATDDFLRHPDDPWEMRHFLQRLSRYEHTGNGRQEVALALLDYIAQAEALVEFHQAYEYVKINIRNHSTDLLKLELLQVISLLAQDHYLFEDPKLPRHYQYKFPLLRSWWRINRGLDL